MKFGTIKIRNIIFYLFIFYLFFSVLRYEAKKKQKQNTKMRGFHNQRIKLNNQTLLWQINPKSKAKIKKNPACPIITKYQFYFSDNAEGTADLSYIFSLKVWLCLLSQHKPGWKTNSLCKWASFLPLLDLLMTF